MSPNHDRYTQQILTTIEQGRPVTQRSLARELGVALGLINLLIRRLVRKGYVRLANIDKRRIRYMITPDGLMEKARVSRNFLENTVNLYTETRQRIRSSLDHLSAAWTDADDQNGSAEKRIIFYGAGDVAEIAYVSLQGSDLKLVGVVDDRRTGSFFGLPVRPCQDLTADSLDGERFGRVVVTSLRHADAIQARLDAAGVPRNRVFVL